MPQSPNSSTRKSSYYKLNFRKHNMTPNLSKIAPRNFTEGVKTPVMNYSRLDNSISNEYGNLDEFKLPTTKIATQNVPKIKNFESLKVRKYPLCYRKFRRRAGERILGSQVISQKKVSLEASILLISQESHI